MSTIVQNSALMERVGFAEANARNLGKVAVFNAKSVDDQVGIIDYNPTIEALLCVNRSGGTLSRRGGRVKWDTANEGPLKAISGYAGAGEIAAGVIPWTIPTAGIANGAVFWLLRKGPMKQAFGANGVAIALGDLIEGGLTGYAQKFSGGGSVLTESAAHTDTTDAANVGTAVTLAKNSLKVGDEFDIIGSGTVVAAQSTDTLTLLTTIGGQTAASSGAIDVATGGVYSVRLTALVRSVGASGSILVTGWVGLGTTNVPIRTVITVDTTSAVAIVTNADWSVASTNNSFTMSGLSVRKTFSAGSLVLPDSRALGAVASDGTIGTLFYTLADFTTRL